MMGLLHIKLLINALVKFIYLVKDFLKLFSDEFDILVITNNLM